ncbi:hypothetical protein DIZ27_24660 [Streptomyces sp. NWU339]|nr:hypothetical protein DIZ27_24660 [Streptomyces sp. NWU339]
MTSDLDPLLTALSVKIDDEIGQHSKHCRNRTVHGFGQRGPLPSWQGPAVWRVEEGRDLSWTSSILAGTAYRLLSA